MRQMPEKSRLREEFIQNYHESFSFPFRMEFTVAESTSHFVQIVTIHTYIQFPVSNAEACSALTANGSAKLYVTISFWRAVKIFDSSKSST